MTAFQHVHDMQFYLLRTNLKDLLYHAVNHVQDCIFLLLHVH